MRTGRLTAVAVTALLGVGLAACSSSPSPTSNNDTSANDAVTAAAAHQLTKPVTVKVYTAYQDAELKALTAEMVKFHAKNPNITVQLVSQGDNNDKAIVAAIKANKSPDVGFSSSADSLGSYCSTGNFIDLKPYLKRDNIDLKAELPPVSYSTYTTYKGDRCALPAEADAYGLYYNKDLLAKAGYTAPPKTTAELLDMAKKLTIIQNGEIKQLGFDPFWGSYQMVPAHTAPSWGAKWVDSKGNSNFAGDPAWKKMAEWQKSVVDAVGGINALKRWVTPTLSTNANSNEWGPDHYFEAGKIAMMIDGEWRTQMIKTDAAKINYGTAAFPVDPDKPELYGAGYVTGNVVGIPKGLDADHQEAAWQVVKYLSLDADFEASFAEAIHNVPTLNGALDKTTLKNDEYFKVFLDIFKNPHSDSSPINSAGTANQDLLAQFLDKTQAGTAGDITAGLASTDKAVNAQLAQTGDGGAP